MAEAQASICASDVKFAVSGMGVGLGSSLAFKTKYLRSEDTPLESIVVVLLAFSSYMLADGVNLSGIISVLFCGMVRKQSQSLFHMEQLFTAQAHVRDPQSQILPSRVRQDMCYSIPQLSSASWCGNGIHSAVEHRFALRISSQNLHLCFPGDVKFYKAKPFAARAANFGRLLQNAVLHGRNFRLHLYRRLPVLGDCSVEVRPYVVIPGKEQHCEA